MRFTVCEEGPNESFIYSVRDICIDDLMSLRPGGIVLVKGDPDNCINVIYKDVSKDYIDHMRSEDV